jgi:hypothetical protein
MATRYTDVFRRDAVRKSSTLCTTCPKSLFGHALGFVAQIVLKTFLPLPQTDSAYGFCLGYAKSGEAI